MTDTYQSDILNCIANLSENEIFTPSVIVNDLLDILPSDIWSNKDVKFLDPCCKTGVFLREIVKRLIIGLKDEFPNFEDRLNHIMSEQIYGISLSELTGLMSRRTVYCSKNINNEYSIVKDYFDNDFGNIYYAPITHEYDNSGTCIHCGFKKPTDDEFDSNLNSHPFLHKDLMEIFGEMKFDVIIGNPPYQIKDGGAASSAKPLYDKFIEKAKSLNPDYITMIIPARWYAGGKGLKDFRNEMLHDERISVIHDFPTTSDCFSDLRIRGGICYFLWDKNHKGDCMVVNHMNNKITSSAMRPLLEDGLNFFIRYNKAINILKKVQSKHESTMEELVSVRNPFGLATNFTEFSEEKTETQNIKLYKKNQSHGYVSINQIDNNKEWVDMYKVIIPYTSPGTDEYPHPISAKPFVIGPKEACTETYLVVSPTNDENVANNVVDYMRTQFFRFLLNLFKSSLHITQKTYGLVPQQDFSKSWSDEELYEKYAIDDEEIKFINSIVKPLS